MDADTIMTTRGDVVAGVVVTKSSTEISPEGRNTTTETRAERFFSLESFLIHTPHNPIL